MFQRGSGILLHISSLPSFGGIGDVGPEAYRFVDFLKKAGQKYWQILPLNPTEQIYGNCPYSSPSAFACNILFISPELLVKQGLLKKDELAALPVSVDAGAVDFPTVSEYKSRLLDHAYQRFKDSKHDNGEFAAFSQEQRYWLNDYAVFTVMKKRFAGKIWSDWPEDIRLRKPEVLREVNAKFRDEIRRIEFLQYIFFKQWHELRTYAREQGVSLIGDMPIYVNEDSADVWSNPGIFKLKDDMKPALVAGVPPDYFSKTGQRWGNPVYDWATIRNSGYGWWLNRVKHNLDLFDIVRIDHFRGLMGFWEIPAADATAINGHWQKGPGEDFLAHLKKNFPQLPIIAEDLGLITPDVPAAMEKFNLPGMKVLQFAFNGDPHHPYLPENYPECCVVYPGTHDNNTSRGWFKSLNAQELEHIKQYFKTDVSEESIAARLMDLALHSRAVMAITPMQDILNLDETARMNVPGTVNGNWSWRLKPGVLTPSLSARLAELTRGQQR